MQTVEFAGHTICCNVALSLAGPELAVRVFSAMPKVDGGAVFYADVISNRIAPIFPDTVPKLTRQTQLHRLLEYPVQVDGWVMEVQSGERKLYQKTKRIVIRRGPLPAHVSAPEFQTVEPAPVPGYVAPSNGHVALSSAPAIQPPAGVPPVMGDAAFALMLRKHFNAWLREIFYPRLSEPMLETADRAMTLDHLIGNFQRAPAGFENVNLFDQAVIAAGREMRRELERVKPECFRPREYAPDDGEDLG